MQRHAHAFKLSAIQCYNFSYYKIKCWNKFTANYSLITFEFIYVNNVVT